MEFSEKTPAPVGPSPSGGAKAVAIVVAAVVVIALGVGAFFLLRPKKQVEVPSLTYWYQEQAEPIATEAGFVIGEVTEESNDESFEGLIIRQSPAAGEVVDEGTPINITLAKGRKFPTSLEVPDLKGMDVEDAEIALMTEFIIGVPGEPQYSEDVEPGKVCAQSEAAGSELPVTAEQIKSGELPVITYYVSLGREKTKVPDVVGKSREEAESAIEKAKLSFDTTSSYSDSVPAGQVISQNIAADTELDTGSLVSVDISMGPQPVERITVPNVATYSLEDARRTIESAGLRFDYAGDAKGFVVVSEPKAGTTVDAGSVVKVTLKVPEPVVQKVQVPDVRGDDEASAKARLENAGLTYEVSGELDGRVSDMNPGANSTVDKGTRVKLTFKRIEQQQDKPAQPSNTTVIINAYGSDGDDGSDVRDNELTLDDVRGIAESKGLGTFESAERIVGDNKVEYWMLTTRDSNGDRNVYFIDPDGGILG